jgi:hypothetical protein
MFPNLLNEATAQKRFVQNMNSAGSNHEPERKNQRDVHSIERFLNRSDTL